MRALQTERLTTRLFTDDDAGFILELVNDAGWLRFIGDKRVRSRDGAEPLRGRDQVTRPQGQRSFKTAVPTRPLPGRAGYWYAYRTS